MRKLEEIIDSITEREFARAKLLTGDDKVTRKLGNWEFGVYSDDGENLLSIDSVDLFCTYANSPVSLNAIRNNVIGIYDGVCDRFNAESKTSFYGIYENGVLRCIFCIMITSFLYHIRVKETVDGYKAIVNCFEGGVINNTITFDISKADYRVRHFRREAL